jgi:hypothetical protein
MSDKPAGARPAGAATAGAATAGAATAGTAGATGPHGLDSVDACRLRLVSLRTRIDTNWPQGGSFLRRRGSRPETSDPIGRLLGAMPSPLPLYPGGPPEPIMGDGDADLRSVAGRAVDAAMALLEGDSLDATYPGNVSMLARLSPETDAAGAEAVELSEPTVGLLVATIIGTLEAVSENLIPSGGRGVRR